MKGGGHVRNKLALLHRPIVVVFLSHLLIVVVCCHIDLVTAQEEQGAHLRRRRRQHQLHRDTQTVDHNPYWDIPPRDTTYTVDVNDTPPADNDYDWETSSTDGSSSTYENDREDSVNNNGVVVMYTETGNDEEPSDNSQPLITSDDEHRFVNECLELLESKANDNGKVTREGYVDFLSQISKNTLQSKTFSELPLFLSMIFFSASCTSGEDCVTREPAITIRPLESEKNQLNQVLCLQLMRFPFLEVMMPFQFLMKSTGSLTASAVLSTPETNTIVPTLEVALDQLLLRGFNCSHIVPGGPLPPQTRPERSPEERSKRRQPQPQHACDYVVDVKVADAADFPCGTDVSCVLLFSDVVVYAVLQESLDEPTLRSLTTNVLRDAINGDALNEFLVYRNG